MAKKPPNRNRPPTPPAMATTQATVSPGSPLIPTPPILGAGVQRANAFKDEELLDVNAFVDFDESEPNKNLESDIAISAELQRELAEAGKIATSTEYELKKEDLEIVENVTEVDSDEGGTKHLYAGEYMRAFNPIRYLISWTFPFRVIKNADNSFLIHSALASVGGVGFMVSTVFAVLLFILTWIGMFSYFLDVPTQKGHGIGRNKNGNQSRWFARAEEIFLLHRNFPTFIVFLTSLFHIVVGNWQFFKKRVAIAEYLTFWTEALQIMKIHSAKDVLLKMVILCILFTSFLISLVIMGVFAISPVVRGGPGFVAHLISRPFVTDLYSQKDSYNVTRAMFGFIFIYIFFAAKIYVFLYMFKCIIMKNTFSAWSSRLDHVVNRDDDFIVRGDRLGKRTGFKELYQDHVVLLDLIDGADMMFADTIESYFTATTFSICFECFYLWRALTNNEEFPPGRKLDAVIVGIFLLQSLLILFMAASLSADVADSAMEGLEVLRRKGFFGRKSGEELYFLMSLYSSYCGAEVTAISGGGYFVLDQSFIVTIVGTFLSYVIILFQFNPPMEFKDDRLVPLVQDRQALLRQAEGDFRAGNAADADEQTMLMVSAFYQNLNHSKEIISKMISFEF